jgi:VanZ family protein
MVQILLKYKRVPAILLLFATLGILIATLYPSSSSFSINIWEYDKLGHFLMFFVWTFLYGLYRATKKNGAPNLWIVFFLGSFYGLMIELLQFIVPTNRSPETYDLIADVLGSLGAIILLKFTFRPNQEEVPDHTA